MQDILIIVDLQKRRVFKQWHQTGSSRFAAVVCQPADPNLPSCTTPRFICAA